MTWVRVEPDAALHPKYFRAGCGAFGFDVAAWGYCNRNLTDGFIPATDLGLVFPGTPPRLAIKWVTALVEVGRWEVADKGWLIRDYHHYQPTRAEVLEERRLHAERSAAGGRARASLAQRIGGRFASRGTSHDTSQSPAARLVGAGEPLDQPQPASDQPRIRTVSDTEENLTTLSGKPDVVTLNGLKGPAREVLAFLNAKTGRSYRPTETNLRLIAARLKSGASVEDCKGVIVRKVRQWSSDPKMASYLRPETLFGATKFESYIGEQGLPS